MFRNKALLLLGIFFMVCFSISPANAISIDLKVLDSYIEVGETFGVEVWADSEGIGEALLAFGFDTNFDSTILNYTGFTMGLDFIDFSDPSNPNNVSGAGISLSDETLLATLFFGAANAGNGSVGVNGIYDGFFNGLIYEVSGANIFSATSIAVNEGTAPVPEPATLLLFGTGLVGLCGIGRARKSPPGSSK